MQLNVPLFFQPPESFDCGVAVAAMLHAFYGPPVESEVLKKSSELQIIPNFGLYTSFLGRYFIKAGFDTTIIGLSPHLFLKADSSLTQEQIAARIASAIENPNTSRFKIELSSQREYLEAGGSMQIRIPSRDSIISEISAGRPVLATLTTRFINGIEPFFNLHWNMITGIDDSHVYANDPSPTNGGKKKYTTEEFFFALNSVNHASPDLGTLLCIKPKHS